MTSRPYFSFQERPRRGLYTHAHNLERFTGKYFCQTDRVFLWNEERSTGNKLENAVGVCVSGGREQWNCVKESVRTCLSFLSAQVFGFGRREAQRPLKIFRQLKKQPSPFSPSKSPSFTF